jgi:hypothetical protein
MCNFGTKSSHAISCVSVELKTNVSETRFISVDPDDGDRAIVENAGF